MTEFTIDCPHGHQTKSGLPRKIVAVLDEPLSTGETIIAVGPDAFGDTGLYRYFPSGKYYESSHLADGSDLINAPAPKRTFKRWYIDLENVKTGRVNGYSFETHEDAVSFTNGLTNVKILAIHEHETVEGTGLDDSNMQNMHSAPEPEEPKMVHLDCWLNVYEWSTGYKTKDDANRDAGSNRIACIHIERDVKVGEGLHD